MMEISELTKEVNEIISSYLPKEEGYVKTVAAAMNYSFSAGGKRLRPLIMYLTYMSLIDGDKEEEVIRPFMAAIEMVHTYSLIHDDLPAMDNDDLRRGLPTCHVKFGEDIAILAGDGLLNFAFETAAKAFTLKPGDVSIEKAFVTFAEKAGIYGMVGGQGLDVEMTGKPLDKDMLKFIYANKTAALLESSMVVGARIAAANDLVCEKIEKSAYNIGMAFQVQDDILDIIGDEAKLGKPVGSDEKNDKYTYATIYGIDRAREYVADKTKEAVEILDEILPQNEYSTTLKGLLISLINRDK